MRIQSLSLVVPTHNKCVNACKFCVSRTHTNPYEDRINAVSKFWSEPKGKEFLYDDIDYIDYFNRLQFARDNGCNVIVLTGTGEPIQNPTFIRFFSHINSKLKTPFKSIEMQTTGVMLTDDDEYKSRRSLYELRRLGITTISFSISNIFDNDRNLELIDCAETLKFDVFNVIKQVKAQGFNVRLSLNLVNDYDNKSVSDVLFRCKWLGADQVTFRKLYKSELNNEIDQWIENNASKTFYTKLVDYVNVKGKLLGILPFGPKIYNIDDMSVVIDDDCMSEEAKDTYKYLVLRENCKLYNRWETKASLIF